MASYDLVQSPVGVLFVGGSDAGIHRIDFLEPAGITPRARAVLSPEILVDRLARESGEAVSQDPAGVAMAVRQLREYFEGQRWTFELPLAPHGTPFQLRVWEALRRIPVGRTISYGELATAIGASSASRAVGAANGRNPLSIVVPCHRVVGAGGRLTGYGGGLERKRWLLEHESRVPGAVSGQPRLPITASG